MFSKSKKLITQFRHGCQLPIKFQTKTHKYEKRERERESR